MEETDILTLLKNEIREQQFVIFVLGYDSVDQKYSFPPGTTRKYVETAADQCGYDLEVAEGCENEGWIALKRRADGVIPSSG
jgi:hypothetical protein